MVNFSASIDAILAQLAALSTGGASNLINAQAWPGEITWNLLLGSSTLRNLHASAPLSLSLHYSRQETDALLAPKASESWVLATLAGYYTVAETNGTITAALSNYSTTVQMAAAIAAAETAANDYTDAALVPYSNTVEVQALIDASLLPYSTKAQREAAVDSRLEDYYTALEVDSLLSTALAGIDLSGFFTIPQADAAIAAAVEASIYPAFTPFPKHKPTWLPPWCP